MRCFCYWSLPLYVIQSPPFPLEKSSDAVANVWQLFFSFFLSSSSLFVSTTHVYTHFFLSLLLVANLQPYSFACRPTTYNLHWARSSALSAIFFAVLLDSSLLSRRSLSFRRSLSLGPCWLYTDSLRIIYVCCHIDWVTLGGRCGCKFI